MRHVVIASLVAIALTGRGFAQESGTAAAPGPSPSIAKGSRTFELRTYHANPGKLEDLHRRFREHTVRLFEKHGMTVVGFWAPTAPAAATNTLVYLLAYPSDEARETSWKAFGNDPEWIAARDASERNGKLVARVESVMMKATDYSAVK
jgi:NIPSNAP protein